MILFAGDCHGDFIPLIEEAGEASAVVLLGDQEPLTDLAVELGPGVAPKTWWICGKSLRVPMVTAKTVLESAADVEEFVETLKRRLLEELGPDVRIRIQ